MPKYGYKLVLVKDYVKEYIYRDELFHLNGKGLFRPIVAVIKIEIPDDAIDIIARPSGIDYFDERKKKRCNKCRFVKVIKHYIALDLNKSYTEISPYLNKYNAITLKEIHKLIGNNKPLTYVSLYNNDFVYEKGKDILPDSFTKDDLVECGKGIHYLKKVEYLNYNFWTNLSRRFIANCLNVNKKFEEDT